MKRFLFCVLPLLFSGCDGPVQIQEFQVVRTLPHDQQAYTQGLVYHEGLLYESTGRLGESSLRKVDPATGEVLSMHALPEEYFGEGLALVGSELFQLTWKAGIAFVYDIKSLTLQRTLEYEGEGWGLCYDGESLYMSNGTDRLYRRDPTTFSLLGEVQVTEGGFSVRALNELECLGNEILANVFQTNRIVRIDKNTGKIISELDGFSLSLASKRPPDPEAVLNGIAHDPVTGNLFVTGKLWPDLFEIEVGG